MSFLMCANFAYSIDFYCCYAPGSNSIDIRQDSCVAGQVELGLADPLEPNGDFCKAYQDKKAGCLVNGKCYEYVKGNLIYDIPAVLDYLGSDIDQCSIVSYDSTCSGDAVIVASSNGTDIDYSGGGGSSLDHQDTTDVVPPDNTAEQKTCSAAGDPYGFFVSEKTCEAIKVNGESCLYNPYRGGRFSTKFQNSDLLNLSSMETACVAKSSIWSCDDYTTKVNCESNPAKGVSPSNLLDSGCIWKPSQTYSQGIYNDKSGVCISASISPNKHFNGFSYSFRGNVLTNPSFEAGSTGWGGFSAGNLRTQGTTGEYTFDGVNSYLINDGSFISQTSNYIAANVAYGFYLYAKTESFDEGANLKFTVESFDAAGNSLDKATFTEFLRDYYTDGNLSNYFEKVAFPSYVTPENTVRSKITLTAEGADIEVDALSFEAFGGVGVDTNELVFKPVEIISSGASNCHLCFDALGFNLCTPQKANLLGDCSYMTSDITRPYVSSSPNYFGKEDNEFSSPTSWKYQAMANSMLFCEMYVTPASCTDPNNYVNKKFNSLHKFSGNSLCKWSSQNGCFKDSDNNNFPDVKEGVPLLRWHTNAEETNIYKHMTNKYVFKTTGTQTSDFAMSCDTLPPNSYAYFIAKDNSGEHIAVSGNMNDLIGDVYFALVMSDATLESCSEYSIEPRLYVDYQVTNSKGTFDDHTYYDLNQEKIYVKADKFFINSKTGESLIDNGNNKISIVVKDQSGNIRSELKYSTNLDLIGPEVSLLSPALKTSGAFKYVDTILGPGSLLKFKVSDMADVDYCDFTLSPLTDGIEDEFYNGSGSFDMDSIANKKDFTYDLELPIINSSANMDAYLFSLSCADVFGQSSEMEFTVRVDFNTDLVVLEPQPFTAFDDEFGFLNGPTDFLAVSTEKSLSSCLLNFNGAVTNLAIDTKTNPFNIDLMPNVDFFSNITGSLSFSSDGFKEGYAECVDINGNRARENLRYYYDTKAPQVLDYELVGMFSGGLQSVIEVGSEYYTPILNPGYFNVTVDGTGSWILEDYGWFYDDSGSYIEIGDASFISELDNQSFESHVQVYNFDSMVGFLKYDLVPGETQLYKITHKLNITDKAGNSKMEEIYYFLDNSTPDFEFSGDIINRIDNKLYTNKQNPTITVDFNAPDYRVFECNVSAKTGALEFELSGGLESGDSFSLSDMSSALNLKKYNGVFLRFNCVDGYGYTLNDDFQLVYDNTPPELNNIYLDGGQNKYYRNLDGLIYPDTVDQLVFDFNETNEEGYFCKYKVESQGSYYSCDSNYFEEQFPGGGGFKVTQPFVLLKGKNTNSTNPICTRTNDFYISRDTAYFNGVDFNTGLKITAECRDFVDLKTNVHTLDVEIDYVLNEIVEFYFEINGNDVIPVVKSVSQFPSGVAISLNENGSNAIDTLTTYTIESNLYVYKGNPLDKSSLVTGDNTMWAVVFDASGSVLDKKSTVLFVDKTSPLANLEIPDEYAGEIYMRDFEVFMDGYDANGELVLMEVFVNGNLVATTDNLSLFDNDTILKPQPSQFYCSTNVCDGRIVFKNGEIGQTYNFEVVVYDGFGNSNSSSMSVLIKDGVALRLVDSVNSLADVDKMSWITNSNAPTIAFETTKKVDFCRIKPFVDDRWVQITGNPLISVESAKIDDSQSFSFNLGDFPDMDLTQLDDGINPVNIICLFNGTFYNYSRNVRMINYLPDYVLTSERGFVINDEPYKFNINVRSVGAYPYISCKYKIDGGSFVGFTQEKTDFFVEELDFNSYSNGEHTLTLLCEDLLGNEGPEKKYKFVVNRNLPLAIDDLKLVGEYRDYEPVGDVIYISDETDLDLSFKVNKLGAQCSYLVDNPAGFFQGIVNFFMDLFGMRWEDMVTSDFPFIFNAEGLTFDENINTLLVQCTHSDGTDVDLEYTVTQITGNVSIDMSRIGLN